MDFLKPRDFHSSCHSLHSNKTPKPSELSSNSASMGGCASRPKDLNGQNPEEAPVEAVATAELTDQTVDVKSTSETAAAAEESKQEEASAEAKAEEAKTDETNGETKEDEAKEDGRKSDEGVAASAEETKA